VAKRWIKGMRDTFFDVLYDIAKRNKNVILISADTGAICQDKFKENLPRQFVNVGIAEQNMIGIAAGFAMTGKIVYVYAIVPFATMRCYEQIRVDLCCMKLPVTIVGVGAGYDYSTLGPTHHGTEDIAVMRSLPGMSIYSLSDNLLEDVVVTSCFKLPGPKYIRLDRTAFPAVHKDKGAINFNQGFSVVKKGSDAYIIATGRMVYNALEAAHALSRQSYDVGVIDLFRIKPLNDEGLWQVIKSAPVLITLEEHFVTGGIGSVLSELIVRKQNHCHIIGINDQFCHQYGSRQHLQKLNQIDIESIRKRITALLRTAR
jgi:transketolase